MMTQPEWYEVIMEDSFGGIWVGEKFPEPFEDVLIKQGGDILTGYINFDGMFCADDELLNDHNGCLKADDGEIFYWTYINE